MIIAPSILPAALLASRILKQPFSPWDLFTPLKDTTEKKTIKTEDFTPQKEVNGIRLPQVYYHAKKEVPQSKEQETVSEVPQIDERLIACVVERVKSEMDLFSKTPSVIAISETVDSLYLGQIAKAQEFLNENAKADLSRIKCLMRTMLPTQYHAIIDKLKQHQDPQVIININGGQNIVAPKANKVEQQGNINK